MVENLLRIVYKCGDYLHKESMKYSIKLNAVNNPDKNVKAFATVTFGDYFKITNIAVVKSREAEPFVSMPSFKRKE